MVILPKYLHRVEYSQNKWQNNFTLFWKIFFKLILLICIIKRLTFFETFIYLTTRTGWVWISPFRKIQLKYLFTKIVQIITKLNIRIYLLISNLFYFSYSCWVEVGKRHLQVPNHQCPLISVLAHQALWLEMQIIGR